MAMPSDASGALSRRAFLKTGVLGGLFLAGGSSLALLTGCATSGPAAGFTFLRPQDVTVMRAIAPVILTGALPAGDDKALDRVIHQLDVFLAGTSPAAMAQIAQLFDLLSLPPARYLLAGVHDDWPKARPADIEAFLGRWRDSRIGMLRAGYTGLVKITTVSWYLLPESWPAIGYQPPVRVV